MISENQKKLIIQLATDNGLQGYRKGFILVNDGKTSDGDRALKKLGFPEALKEHKAEFVDILIEYKKYQSDIARIVVAAAKEMGDRTAATLASFGEDTSGTDLRAKIMSLIPVVDITGRGKEKILLLDPETRRPVHDFDTEIYMLRTGTNEQELLASSDIMNVVPLFNPYSLEPMISRRHESLDVEVNHINTYVPPKWRYIGAEAKYEGFIRTLMEWLFPVAEEREDVLDWIHHAITYRNGTILCLAGPRGTGKSLLMSIVSYLIGDKYFELVNKEILEEKFNSAFKNRRLIIFEEVEVDNSVVLNRLKALANNKIVLEEKGQDSQTIDNFTSMAILLNDISQLKVEAQERRFSIPKVAEHDLKRAIPEKEIENFANRMLGEEVVQEIAEFGEFILARKPRRTWMYPIKGDYYYHICALSMPEWKNFIVKYIAEKGQDGVPILTSTISAAFAVAYNIDDSNKRGGLRFPDRYQKIEQFLKDYKHRGEYYIGSITREYKGNREYVAILPNTEYLNYIDEQKALAAPEKEMPEKKKLTGAAAMYALEKEKAEKEALDAL